MSKVLVIPDLQIPFEHPDALRFCKRVHKEYGCDHVVNIGDEIDNYAISDYVKSTKAHSDGEEFSLTMKRLKKWYRAFPKMQVCISNHTWRPYKKAENIGIPERFMRGIGEVLGAPTSWVWDYAFEIDGIRYVHGDKLPNSPKSAWISELCSTIMGHHHSKSEIVYFRGRKEKGFIAYTGALIDEEAYAFNYNPKKNTQLSCMVVIHGTPVIVPMHVDENQRWTGSLKV